MNGAPQEHFLSKAVALFYGVIVCDFCIFYKNLSELL